MKTINVTFENNEFKEIIKLKPKNISWREFILKAVRILKETEKLKNGN